VGWLSELTELFLALSRKNWQHQAFSGIPLLGQLAKKAVSVV
jgi:hypothetical protein